MGRFVVRRLLFGIVVLLIIPVPPFVLDLLLALSLARRHTSQLILLDFPYRLLYKHLRYSTWLFLRCLVILQFLFSFDQQI